MSAERPILFSAPMVRAILAGAKTQTRRVVKPAPPAGADPRWTWCAGSTDRRDVGAFHYGVLAPDGQTFTDRGRERQTPYRCHYGSPGDTLWVRETWACLDSHIRPGARLAYRADTIDGERVRVDAPWRPSIHMPRWASRITLRVTSVRVEQAREISEDDASAEGIVRWTKDRVIGKFAPADEEGDGPCWPWQGCPYSARDAFERLWCEINGTASWESDPWVWVVGFERVQP